MTNNHKQEFIRIFNELTRSKNPYEVFRDFVTMSSISLHNAVSKSQELEEEYLLIASSYNKEDLIKITNLFAEVVMGLEERICDFLGDLYMQLEIGNKNTGQFFTPYEVSKLMATLTHGDMSKLKQKQFVTLSEPACGSGSMVIAYAETMLENNLNPQAQLWVQAVDIDPVPAMMCYLQLSLMHIPGEVIVGNSLSMSVTKVMKTPAHYLGFWDSKLKDQNNLTQTVNNACIDVEKINAPNELHSKEEVELAALNKTIIENVTQMSFFDAVV